MLDLCCHQHLLNKTNWTVLFSSSANLHPHELHLSQNSLNWLSYCMWGGKQQTLFVKWWQWCTINRRKIWCWFVYVCFWVCKFVFSLSFHVIEFVFKCACVYVRYVRLFMRNPWMYVYWGWTCKTDRNKARIRKLKNTILLWNDGGLSGLQHNALASLIPALFLSCLQVHPYMKWHFFQKLFSPSFCSFWGVSKPTSK